MNSFTSARNKVLAAKHTASLQLLCTVGGNQARLDARTEFENLEPSLGGVEAGRAHHCIKVRFFQFLVSFEVGRSLGWGARLGGALAYSLR